jgi:hypothetical protein
MQTKSATSFFAGSVFNSPHEKPLPTGPKQIKSAYKHFECFSRLSSATNRSCNHDVVCDDI